MDTNKNNSKVIILGIILLIIAGIIVVALKGFTVSLMFGKHESIELKVGKEVNINAVKEICNEVFGDKKYVAKELEVFGDSFQINVESITDDEKTNLINKVNEKFEVSKTVEDFNINSISNKRIRDVIKPYIIPMAITFVIMIVYSLIRYKKLGALKIVGEFMEKIVLLEAVLISIVAIARIPVNDLVILVLVIVPIMHLIHFINKDEKKLEELNEE